MNQMDLPNIYRIFHPNTKEYTFFLTPHGIFSKIDHILENKAKNKNGVIPYILSDQHELKLEFNNHTNLRKPKNSWR